MTEFTEFVIRRNVKEKIPRFSDRLKEKSLDSFLKKQTQLIRQRD